MDFSNNDKKKIKEESLSSQTTLNDEEREETYIKKDADCHQDFMQLPLQKKASITNNDMSKLEYGVLPDGRIALMRTESRDGSTRIEIFDQVTEKLIIIKYKNSIEEL